MKYWNGESVAALGPTGTGYLSLGSESAVRYKWKVSEAQVEIERLGKKELELENQYLGLRTYLGIPMQSKWFELLKEWQNKNYALLEDGRIKLTSLGFLMLDSLMDDIFRSEQMVSQKSRNR
jgi:oxygen-independent coproporphyrinogen-3 oxidase